MTPVERILSLLEEAGGRRYGGEAVTQLAHALQCANWAEAADASEDLIAAALLHDIGHLVYREPEEAMAEAVDDLHESRGARFLEAWFPKSVTEPVRLHVPAKRYLCATDTGYQERLSEASIQSLELQGGPYTEIEAKAFIAQDFAADAVKLRRWDEAAKDPDAETPPLARYRPLLLSVMDRV